MYTPETHDVNMEYVPLAPADWITSAEQWSALSLANLHVLILKMIIILSIKLIFKTVFRGVVGDDFILTRASNSLLSVKKEEKNLVYAEFIIKQ